MAPSLGLGITLVRIKHPGQCRFNQFYWSLFMLRERKELLEREIVKLHKEAAAIYLNCMVSGTTDPDYDKIKAKLHDLKFDLNVVDQLLAQGNI